MPRTPTLQQQQNIFCFCLNLVYLHAVELMSFENIFGWKMKRNTTFAHEQSKSRFSSCATSRFIIIFCFSNSLYIHCKILATRWDQLKIINIKYNLHEFQEHWTSHQLNGSRALMLYFVSPEWTWGEREFEKKTNAFNYPFSKLVIFCVWLFLWICAVAAIIFEWLNYVI